MAQAHDSRKPRDIEQHVYECLEKASSDVGRAKADLVARHCWEVFSEGEIESPIEQMVYCGLMAVATTTNFLSVFEYGVPFSKELHMARVKSVESATVLCYPQMPIGRYRADFVIHAVSGENHAPLVLELDGHQWHERSEPERRKEKKRDRYMQSLGLRVARYTGSEAYKDPFGVACEALDLSVGVTNHFINPRRMWGD